MDRTWKTVWASRRLDAAQGSTLAQLMAADGLDTGFGSVGEANWRAFVERVGRELALSPGDRLFEVGCGAGAFLYPLHERGVCVAGVDQSDALIGYAAAAMPGRAFGVADAAAFELPEPADAVVSCGVFLYFPSLDYAAAVIRRMARAAKRRIAILDVPDAAKQEFAMALRRGSYGPAEYEARYAGLDHLYFDKAWMAATLAACGVTAVRIEDQSIDGYANAAYRFNVFGATSGAAG